MKEIKRARNLIKGNIKMNNKTLLWLQWEVPAHVLRLRCMHWDHVNLRKERTEQIVMQGEVKFQINN